ncbi:class IV adenylate cyclase [Fervidicoccus fontis]|uniref:Class IV adenylate cyclase n=1 Tax=Fervidicoccus fontis TaxID=683846 RepID=A0A7C2VAT5_9CREN|nr:class IV adenylate cyclase [Fervidicoccus fontis]PMB76932.1 MAG: class IV adenylate cyclase [Fervidicoccus fontis]HEW63940.1 class IV adenylate cyclase [Fervidicoccus fontis]
MGRKRNENGSFIKRIAEGNNMIETEVKIKIDDNDEKRIRDFAESSCIFREKVSINDIYLIHPCIDFSKTDEAVRIRIESTAGIEKVKITYKGKRNKDTVFKKREEIEFEVKASPNDVISFFLRNRYRVLCNIEKDREIYECKGFYLMIDNVKDLGKYIELEQIGKNEKSIQIFLESFNLKEKIEPLTYLELIMKK